MTKLFSPITFRGVTAKNRVGVSPMCMYSAEDGFANEWHVQHIGSRATGGAGMVIMEATAVTPEGRITPGDLGLWKDDHIETLSRIVEFGQSQGAVMGIQLAHAGRKASMGRPWEGGKKLEAGGWQTIAPSALAFAPDYNMPRPMTVDDIQHLRDDFVESAMRAVRAGFQLIEIHGAYGYLLNEFISPLSNTREDEYGGSEDNRFRLILEIAEMLRNTLPKDVILAARLSCSDWKEGGITIENSVRLSKLLRNVGVDFIDCSSGGLVPDAKIVTGPGYQVPFAAQIKKEADIPVAAVGMITDAKQAEEILQKDQADLVFLARAMLKDPYWPLHAAKELGAETPFPKQYGRGF